MSAMEKRKIKSRADGLKLGLLLCRPEGEPRGVVQLVHGMCEHKERYAALMEYLADRGFVCAIHDHRGHGESVRSPEDLGYLYRDGALAMVEDVHQVTELLKKRWPGLPLYLFGHSMGSLAVRAYLKKYDRELAGLMVCGCPSENPGAGAGKFLVQCLRVFHGDHYRSKFLQRLAFGKNNAGILNPQSPSAWVCANEDTVRDYDRDPLCGYVFTLNGFYELFKLMQTVYSRRDWNVTRPNLPIWFLSGEDDPCMISKEKFQEAVELLHTVGYRDVTYKLYPGLRHEILNERSRDQVYADILSHLEAWERA